MEIEIFIRPGRISAALRLTQLMSHVAPISRHDVRLNSGKGIQSLVSWWLYHDAKPGPSFQPNIHFDGPLLLGDDAWRQAEAKSCQGDRWGRLDDALLEASRKRMGFSLIYCWFSFYFVFYLQLHSHYECVFVSRLRHLQVMNKFAS